MTSTPFMFTAPQTSSVFTDAQILDFEREAAKSATGSDDLTLRTVRLALDAMLMSPDDFCKAKAFQEPTLLRSPIAHVDVEAWSNGADTSHCFARVPFPGSRPAYLSIEAGSQDGQDN